MKNIKCIISIVTQIFCLDLDSFRKNPFLIPLNALSTRQDSNYLLNTLYFNISKSRERFSRKSMFCLLLPT
ncbi:MAG: hypothetical protein ACD_71C00105G0001, partial [uncultured bacterium (gcode 4)]